MAKRIDPDQLFLAVIAEAELARQHCDWERAIQCIERCIWILKHRMKLFEGHQLAERIEAEEVDKYL